MTNELADRLRDPENNWNSGGRFQAANEIERLESQITQLRGNLSLAEEGLANATQEIERLTKDRDQGWKNYYELRKQSAEIQYPGMTATVHAHEPGACACDLRGLLSKWVSYMDLSGAQPVSGDLRDNPVLALLQDSRKALEWPSRNDWRPVETAPEKDGFYWCYLSECPPQSYPQQAIRFTRAHRNVCAGIDDPDRWWTSWTVSHWKPLPERPSKKSGESQS